MTNANDVAVGIVGIGEIGGTYATKDHTVPSPSERIRTYSVLRSLLRANS